MSAARQKAAAHASAAPGLDIRDTIANEDGGARVDVQGKTGSLDHAGTRLTAITIEPIALDRSIRKVRAVLYRLKPHALRKKPHSDIARELEIVGLSIKAPGNPRLIGDDDEEVAGRLQLSQAIDRTRNEDKSLQSGARACGPR